jgi:uncharacterized protein (DUF58 family)
MDLMGVRPYRPGDPVRDLHARTWAKAGIPVVREYQEAYFTRVAVIVDTDRTVFGRRQFEAALSMGAGVVAHLSRGETLIDLLVAGEQVHTLTLGRSLGHLDQALDLLACVRTSGKLDPARVVQRIAPHLPRLSASLLVLPRWDEPRRELVRRIQGYGVACRVIVIDPPAIHRRHPRAAPGREEPISLHVSTESIERGEPLCL